MLNNTGHQDLLSITVAQSEVIRMCIVVNNNCYFVTPEASLLVETIEEMITTTGSKYPGRPIKGRRLLCQLAKRSRLDLSDLSVAYLSQRLAKRKGDSITNSPSCRLEQISRPNFLSQVFSSQLSFFNKTAIHFAV